ncbi:DUF2292 domain-containing protein [Candidatus Omnitrophota bacterium]
MINKNKQIQHRSPVSAERNVPDSALLLNIRTAIKDIKYGSIQVHVQDGKVVQIDTIRKVRMR